MFARITGIAVGIWLMVSPAVLNYGGDASTNSRIFGPTAAAIAIIAVSEVTRPVRWLNLAIGAWLIAAPFLLGYGFPPLVNSVISGVVLIVVASIRGNMQQRFGGGWSSLFKSNAA